MLKDYEYLSPDDQKAVLAYVNALQMQNFELRKRLAAGNCS